MATVPYTETSDGIKIPQPLFKLESATIDSGSLDGGDTSKFGYAEVVDGELKVQSSAVGDETTASESADSTVPATLIERVTALVDALTSGQADDEVRVALAADLLSGALSVSVDGQSGTLDVSLSSESLTGNLDVDIAAQTSGALTVTDDGALNINSLPSLPTGTNNIGAVDLGSLNGAATESTLSNVLTKLTNAEDGDGNAFDANMTAKVLTSAPSASDGSWHVPWLDSSRRVQVMDQNPILVADNSIETVRGTDSVVAADAEKTVKTATFDASSSGNIVAGISSTKIRVLSASITTDTAHKVQLLDGSGGSALLTVYAGQNSGIVREPQAHIGETGAGNALYANLGGANNTAIHVEYVEV